MPGNSSGNIPGPGKAVDGVSTMPGRAMVPFVDWDSLEREFVTNPDYPSVQTWLVQVKGWPYQRVRNGNTLKHIVGWSNKRATLQQRLTEKTIKAIEVEQRKKIPDIMRAKALLISKIISDIGSWELMGSKDKKLMYQIIKTELGEPTNINLNANFNSGGDPVVSLLEQYGLMKEGRIIDIDQPKTKEVTDGSKDRANTSEVVAPNNGS